MKRFLILAFVAIMCFTLVSCNKNSPEGLEDYQKLLTDESSNEGNQEETEVPFAERVYVIIPQSCSAELSAKASLIAEKITEKTGVPVSVKYDNEDTLSQGNNLEILIGATNRMRSKEVLEPLRVGEYLCCWDRGTIIIGGRYEESTLQAADDFIEKILHGATFSSLMGADVRLEKTVEYDIDQLTLNGYDLYDFTIMYHAANENYERHIATFLRDCLAKQSGYLLDIIPHTERTEQTGKVICVGNALNDAEDWQKYEAKIKTLEGNDILVDGKGSYGISAAAAELISKISASTVNKKGNVDLSSHTLLEARNAPVKLCCAFVSGAQSAEQIYDFTENIRDGGNDLILFSPTSAQAAKHIKFNKCSYEFYSADMEDGSVLCVLYNADVFKDVTLDTETAQPSVTFKSLADGKEYRVSIYSDREHVAEYETHSRDILVFDLPESEDNDSIDGFTFVGQASKKSLYIDEGFVLDENFEAKNNSNSEWSNLFCSFKMHALFCDEYVTLKDAVE